ncbi:hypothetical protein [Halobacterium wangiae]|uniref:hypothetical protein n=1 Tax=Halobacterium wangiae TaxID=2902623 RepID=UPI001E53144D|nr:hypothetical protein [Halobacterium wangiae]
MSLDQHLEAWCGTTIELRPGTEPAVETEVPTNDDLPTAPAIETSRESRATGREPPTDPEREHIGSGER